jgi:hypothetical protein
MRATLPERARALPVTGFVFRRSLAERLAIGMIKPLFSAGMNLPETLEKPGFPFIVVMMNIRKAYSKMKPLFVKGAGKCGCTEKWMMSCK